MGPTESNAVTWDGGGPKNGNRGEKTPHRKNQVAQTRSKSKEQAKRKEKSRLVSFSFFFWGSLKVSKCALL